MMNQLTDRFTCDLNPIDETSNASKLVQDHLVDVKSRKPNHKYPEIPQYQMKYSNTATKAQLQPNCTNHREI